MRENRVIKSGDIVMDACLEWMEIKIRCELNGIDPKSSVCVSIIDYNSGQCIMSRVVTNGGRQRFCAVNGESLRTSQGWNPRIFENSQGKDPRTREARAQPTAGEKQ